jgi:hypothetical protein
MLELQKFVLRQVCDNKELFIKEFHKSMKWLEYEEIEILRNWVLQTFGSRYKDLVMEELEVL